MFINFYKFDATVYRVLRRRVYGNNKYIFTRTCVVSKILCYIKLTLTTSAKIRRCLLVLFILSVCLRSHSRLIKLKKKKKNILIIHSCTNTRNLNAFYDEKYL